jgi:hypothetical protein
MGWQKKQSGKSNKGDSPSSGGDDWRGGKRRASSPASRPPITSTMAWSDEWTKGSTYHKTDRDFRYRVKLMAFGALALALIGVLLFVIFYFPTRTPLYAVAVTAYRPVFPPNGYALEDVERLEGLFQSNTNVKFSRATRTSMTGSELISQVGDWLETANPGGPRFGDGAVLLYISCHGLVNDEGEACLVTSEAEAWRTEDWVPVRQLFQMISEAEELPEKTRKVVLLDCNRIHANWSLGVLYNQFADRVAEAVRELNDPNLIVLNSTGMGQVGYADPARGASAFGYFVASALSGKADGDGDSKISLHELHQYLRAEVSERVKLERGAAQTPMLIPPQVSDFPLVWVTDDKPLAEVDPVALNRSIQNAAGPCADLWQQHEALLLASPYVTRPAAWAELNHKLLYLEQLIVAGQAYSDRLASVQKEASQLIQQLKQAVGSQSPVLELATVDEGEQRRGQATLRQWREARAATEPPPPEEMPKTEYQTAAAAVWRSALEGNQGPDAVPELLSFLGDMETGPPIEPTEIHFLRMLTKWIPAGESAEFFATALQRYDAGNRAIAATNERGQYWILDTMEAADDERRLAEDHLLVGNEEDLRQADRRWEQLASASDDVSYARAWQDGKTITDVYLLRDRAWATFPHLARWVCDHSQFVTTDPAAFDQMYDLLKALHALGDELDKSWRQTARVVQIKSLGEDVSRNLNGLFNLYSSEVNRLRVRSGDRKSTFREIALLLECPLTTGVDRNLLRNRQLKFMFTDADAAEQSDESIQVSDEEYLARLTELEHPAFAIANTNQLQSYRKRELSVVPPVRLKSDASRDEQLTSLVDQSAALRGLLDRLWTDAKELTNDFDARFHDRRTESPAVVRGDLNTADRMVRARIEFFTESPWTNTPNDKAPATRLREVDEFFRYMWQFQRVVEDGWGPSPANEPAYFERVAEAYYRAGLSLCPKAAGYLEEDRQSFVDRRQALSRATDGGSSNGVIPDVDNRYVTSTAKSTEHDATFRWSKALLPGRAAFYVTSEQGQAVPLMSSNQQLLNRFGIGLDDELQNESKFQFSHDDVDKNGLHYVANTLFRFHQRSDPFTYDVPEAGSQLVVEYKVPPRPKVIVRGDNVKKSWVIFIVDFSGSMDEDDGQGATRAARAMAAIKTILQRLPQNTHEIGVLCYGHRAQWRRAEGNLWKVVWRDRAAQSAQVDPRFDVAWLDADLKRADATLQTRNKINQLLGDLTYFGETPLYLAMKTALAEFGSAFDRDTDRRLIVITDGENNQTNLQPTEEVKAILRQNPVWTSIEDIRRMHETARLKNVAVDILYMGANAGSPSPKLAELQRFAEETKNRQFLTVNKTDRLIAEMIEALGAYEFYVRRSGDPEPPTPVWEKLGETFEVPWNGVGGDMFEVVVRGARNKVVSTFPLQLFGGERKELYLQGARLVQQRYRQGLQPMRQTENLIEEGNRGQAFFVGVHRPDLENVGGRTEAKFVYSLQHVDEKLVSPRPKQMWVEITPRTVVGRQFDTTFVLYDLVFEENRPVDVLTVRIPNWPDGYELAKMRLWLKTTDPRPSKPITVADAVKTSPFDAIDDGRTKILVETTGGMTTTDAYRVTVVEQHAKRDTVRSLRVHMTPRPQRVSHRYLEDAREVHHEFVFPNKFAVGQPQIHITHADRVKSGAIDSGELDLTLQ